MLFMPTSAKTPNPTDRFPSLVERLNLGRGSLLQDLGLLLFDRWRLLPVATRATFSGVIAVFWVTGPQRRQRLMATGKSAATYALIAMLWQLVEDEWSWTGLIAALALGATIAPGLAPWVRLFPLTGDPTLVGGQRAFDIMINALVHLLAASVLVFGIKSLVSLGASLGAESVEFPSFFKGSIGLVAANYGRKLGTELLGVHVVVRRHPLGPSLLAHYADTGIHQAYQNLCAWHELRERPGPGWLRLSLRGFGQPPGGCRSLIDESKVLDPLLAGVIDHFLR